MVTPRNESSVVALTGATGLIGHYVLAALLRTGTRCLAFVRTPIRDELRLKALLAPLSVDVAQAKASGQLLLLESDLNGSIARSAVPVHSLIHAAGCTRFQSNAQGDPYRTNVEGTKNLLEWADSHAVRDVHLISTAYAGVQEGASVPESVRSNQPRFRNDYERSKWQCEQVCARWATTDARTLTVYRPSIVVGDSISGRTTTMTGFYLAVRGAQMVAQCAHHRSRHDPARVTIRLPGLSTTSQNIVPVDYIAAMIAGIALTPALHGRVYHLVHPFPPTNQDVRDAVEQHFGPCGFWFDPALTSNTAIVQNTWERAFTRLIEPVQPYLHCTSLFERDNTEEAERRLRLRCPAMDRDAIVRLCDFVAPRAERGAPPYPRAPLPLEVADSRHIEKYFGEFLPQLLGDPQVARVSTIDAVVRFVITDVDNGQWVCRFERGALTAVHRGANTLKEDFAYRTNRETFLNTVSGLLEPQQAFLSGKAHITGDVEKALKMAFLFHRFTQESPFASEREDLHD